MMQLQQEEEFRRCQTEREDREMALKLQQEEEKQGLQLKRGHSEIDEESRKLIAQIQEMEQYSLIQDAIDHEDFQGDAQDM